MSKEPVVWKVVNRTNGEFMFSRVKPMARVCKYEDVIPLYASPPKRKPLSYTKVLEGLYSQGVVDYGTMAFIKGVKWAEKAHGIGDRDDTQV